MNLGNSGPLAGLLLLLHQLAGLVLVGCLMWGALRLIVSGYWPRELTKAAAVLVLVLLVI